jgi:F420H(2)-dependent quinone reductase
MPTRSAMRFQWRSHKLIWKLSGGRLGNRVVGMPVLELVTTGNKSNASRSVLLTYVDDPGGPVVFGTNAGLDRDPAWVINLRVAPSARLRCNGRWHDCTAVEIVDEADRQRLWSQAVTANHTYSSYLATINRPVPIVSLRIAE